MTKKSSIVSSRHAAVSLLFAIALIPIMMLVGLAIDFGFYNEAQSQLDMAADAAAMHAARVAMLLNQQNDPAYRAKGRLAGMAWFTAQEGTVPQVQTGSITPDISITPTAKNAVQVQVTYSGWLQTHFARLFPAGWPGYPNWHLAGGATAIISVPRYTEVQILIDNSSSMMIAATDSDIKQMESLTPCSQQAANGDDQTLDQNYSWAYTPVNGVYTSDPPLSAYSAHTPPLAPPGTLIPFGYGTFYYKNTKGNIVATADIVPEAPRIGQCDYRFTGPADECLYPPAMLRQNGKPLVNASGQCVVNGVPSGGGPGSLMAVPGITIPAGAQAAPNRPMAPCAFACHNQPNSDYYALARSNGILLRYDVVHQAAGSVLTAMQSSASSGELSAGVFEFNAPGVSPNGIQEVYPPASAAASFSNAEAGTDFAAAQQDTVNVEPPVTGNGGDTYFENALSQLAGFVTPAGSGTVPAAPVKNLFIVTDGMDDYYSASCIPSGRCVGPINPAAPQSCDYFKTPVAQGGLGYTVYVLYIKYFPLPNPFYLSNAARYFVGSDAVEAALRACASAGDFYISNDGSPSSINNAFKEMLASAIGSAGRYTK